MPSAVRVVPACLALLLLLGACAVEGRDLLAIKNDDGDSSGKGASIIGRLTARALTLAAAAAAAV